MVNSSVCPNPATSARPLYPDYITFPMTTEAKNRYYEENVRLIHKVIQPYKGSCEYEDLFQEASIGFIKGLSTYDPSKGVLLSTYCYKCCRNELNQYIRHSRSKGRSGNVVSLDAELPGADGKALNSIENITVSEADDLHQISIPLEELVSRREIAQEAARVIEEDLNENERIAFILYSQGITQNMIAKELSISQANVSKIIRLAKCKIIYGLRQAKVLNPDETPYS